MAAQAGDWNETKDFVAIGSGGGSMSSSLYLRSIGKETLVLEKTDMFGGSTAMSGGVMWIPYNSLMRRAGVQDSYENAQAYLQATVGDVGPASSPERRRAYLTTGPKMLEFLMAQGIRFVYPDGWSDYYDDRPGGVARSRSVVPAPFDMNELGPWKDLVRRSPYTKLPIQAMEGVKLLNAKRSLSGAITAVRVAARTAKARLLNQDLKVSGTSLQGQMLKAVLKAGGEVRLNSPCRELVQEDGRVVGVVTEKDGQPWRIRAREGVLINAGGFARNAEMRKKYQPQPSSTKWTNSNPGDTGEMINMAVALGAKIDLMDATIWTPGTYVEGQPRAYHANWIMSKPHLIAVDRHGRRFANEVESYMEFGQAMYRVGAVPAFLVFDQRHRGAYPWGQFDHFAPPGITPRSWFENGYMKRADSLAELARLCGIDPNGLEATVARFNEGARAGKDPDFRRGERAYDLVWGDSTHKPSAVLGTIEKPPFYGVELVPGDVGTFGGVLTDEHARVLKEDGVPIPGLYATGNSTASVMGRCYPGSGASVGASCIFGYRAARHASGTMENA